MRKLYSYFFFAFVCLGFTACQDHSSTIKYIPKDALGIFCLNSNQLSKKVAWSALADSRIFQELAHNAAFDIEETGIDPHARIYAFGLPDKRLQSNFKFLTLFPLKDEKAFLAYLKKTFPAAQFKKISEFQFAVLDQNTCVGWNKKTAIGAYTAQNITFNNQTNPEETLAILKEEIRKSFSLPKDQSILQNKLYLDLEKEDHDFSFWFNLEAFSKATPQSEMNSTSAAILSSQKKLLKNTFFDGGIDFEKGRIEIDGKVYHNSSGLAVAQSFLPVHYGDELLQKVPGDQLNLMLHLQLNPKGLTAFLDTIGVLPITKMALKENDLNPDTIFNLFSGHFLLTAVDFNFKNFVRNFNSSLSGEAPVPFIQTALMFNVNNREALRQLFDLAVKEQLLAKIDSNIFQGQHFYCAVKDHYVIVAPFLQTVKKLLANEGTKDWAVPGDLNHNPFGLYVDVKNTVSSVNAELSDEEKKQQLGKALNLLDHIQAYGGKIKDDYSSFHATIFFQNKERNSLLQLIELRNN